MNGHRLLEDGVGVGLGEGREGWVLARGEGGYKQLSIRNVPICEIIMSTQAIEVSLGVGSWGEQQVKCILMAREHCVLLR